MKKALVYGSEFKTMRLKIKKDKIFFAKLDNKEQAEKEYVEKAVPEVIKELNEESLVFNLPIGNQNKIFWE